MQAMLETVGDVVVVHLRGKLDYTVHEMFRSHCLKHLIHSKIVFNFQDLCFVGSLGVTDFVETIRQVVSLSGAGVKFGSVSNEYRRLMETLIPGDLPIYETVQHALLAFQGYPIPYLPRLSAVEDGTDRDFSSSDDNMSVGN